MQRVVAFSSTAAQFRTASNNQECSFHSLRKVQKIHFEVPDGQRLRGWHSAGCEAMLFTPGIQLNRGRLRYALRMSAAASSKKRPAPEHSESEDASKRR